MFALLLVRRVGLAAGTYLFVYYLLALPNNSDASIGRRIGVALGAAIFAFFAPQVRALAKRE